MRDAASAVFAEHEPRKPFTARQGHKVNFTGGEREGTLGYSEAGAVASPCVFLATFFQEEKGSAQ